MNKLGTAFHETFRLTRSSLSQILQVVSDAPNALTLEDFKQETTLGNNQIKSARRYAYGAGLVDEKERPTFFGNLCKERDAGLSQQDSQWLIHYNLAVPHGAGPQFWNFLCEKDLPRETNRTEIAEMVKDFDDGKLANTTYLAAATVWAGTYLESESLGQLGFLEEQGQSSGQYLVTEPHPISVNAFACVLVDYWESNWGERGDVLLSELAPLARLLRAQGILGSLLKELEKSRLIVNQRRVSPFGVRRLWEDSAAVWREHLYA